MLQGGDEYPAPGEPGHRQTQHRCHATSYQTRYVALIKQRKLNWQLHLSESDTIVLEVIETPGNEGRVMPI